MKKIFILVVLIALILVASQLAYYFISKKQNSAPDNSSSFPIEKNNFDEKSEGDGKLPLDIKDNKNSFPISDAASRITKKPFGIYINPGSSPVQPEKFTGYHTGTDFEVKDEELDQDVEVSAICRGEIVKQQRVTGYGGVIIQKCDIDNKEVRVLYGHLVLAKKITSVGDLVTSGDKIAVLADQNSEDAFGERKHLHLGIYPGKEIDWRGYVASENELARWLNPAQVLNL